MTVNFETDDVLTRTIARFEALEKRIDDFIEQAKRAETAGAVIRRTVAQLNAFATIFEGQVAYARDGRKIGEGAGAGTGVLVYYDGTAWRRSSDDSTVAS